MYNQYIILADAKPGREREFDDWYYWVHSREVMEPRIAAIAAQCFRRVRSWAPGEAGDGQNFVCLYENSDPAAMTGADASYAHMLMSSAVDTATPMGGGYYDTITQHIRYADAQPAALVVEWIDAKAEQIARYGCARLHATLQKPGVFSAWLGKASAHQLYAAPRPAYVAIYRVASAAQAAAAWREAAVQDLPMRISASCFTPLFPRVTRQQVLAPDAGSQEKIAEIRAAVLAANDQGK